MFFLFMYTRLELRFKFIQILFLECLTVMLTICSPRYKWVFSTYYAHNKLFGAFFNGGIIYFFK